MGGKKKLSLSQMEKLQRRQREQQRKVRLAGKEKKTANVLLPEIKDDLINELKKMRVITPYGVASKLDLRISVAKDFLEELERKGIVKFVSRSRKIKVYTIAA